MDVRMDKLTATVKDDGSDISSESDGAHALFPGTEDIGGTPRGQAFRQLSRIQLAPSMASWDSSRTESSTSSSNWKTWWGNAATRRDTWHPHWTEFESRGDVYWGSAKNHIWGSCSAGRQKSWWRDSDWTSLYQQSHTKQDWRSHWCSSNWARPKSWSCRDWTHRSTSRRSTSPGRDSRQEQDDLCQSRAAIEPPERTVEPLEQAAAAPVVRRCWRSAAARRRRELECARTGGAAEVKMEPTACEAMSRMQKGNTVLRAVQQLLASDWIEADNATHDSVKSATLTLAEGLACGELAELVRACARARLSDAEFVADLAERASMGIDSGAGLSSLAHLVSSFMALGELCEGGIQACTPLLAAVTDRFRARWAQRQPCPPIDVLEFVRCLAIAGRLTEQLHDAAWDALRRWALQLEGDASGLPAGPINRRSWQTESPCVLAGCSHWDIVWKPARWAMSWTVSVSSNHTAVPATALSLPLVPDHPFASGSSKAQDLLDWLLDEGREPHAGRLPIRRDALVSYGVMHRLDAGTSGPLCCARTYYGWAWLSLQFSALRVIKEYVCLCHGWVPVPQLNERSIVSLPLRTERGRSVVDPAGGRRAITELQRVAHLADSRGDKYSLVEVSLWTGRLHQIRAHMSAKGHPIVSDSAYGADMMHTPWCPRLFLHCYHLCLPADEFGPNKDSDVLCSLPMDLREALQRLTPANVLSARTASAGNDVGEGARIILREWASSGCRS